MTTEFKLSVNDLPLDLAREVALRAIRSRALGGDQTVKNASLMTAVTVSALAALTPAHAGNGDVAAGLLGGFAAGAIVGSVLAPRPAPVYVAPAPVYVAPTCYWTWGQPMWDGYRWVRPRVQVCD